MTGDAKGSWTEQKNGTAFYLANGKKFLSVTNDVVELKVKDPKIAAGQLWYKGKNSKGYFTLKNKETSQLLRATRKGVFAVKGENTAAFPWYVSLVILSGISQNSLRILLGFFWGFFWEFFGDIFGREVFGKDVFVREGHLWGCL